MSVNHAVLAAVRTFEIPLWVQIMAFGQTGAGKTFTMSGGKDSYKQRGLTPRAISAIFRELALRPATAGIVRVRVKVRLQRPHAQSAAPRRRSLRRQHTTRCVPIVSRAVCTLQVSYAELYNESIYDLLNSSKNAPEISLSEDARG